MMAAMDVMDDGATEPSGAEPRPGPFARLRARQEWAFFGALRQAAPGEAAAWWVVLVARGSLPPLIGVLSGWLITAITAGDSLTAPLMSLAIAFVLAQVVGPLHEAIGSDLGDRTSTALNDRLMRITTGPPGLAHLERADLAGDLSMARDFDLGITGPPLSVSMNFIADGLVATVVGIVSAAVLAVSGWWQAGLLVIAWTSTHWLLRESGVWRDRNTPQVQRAQRDADYHFRLAVDPPAAKEIRLFGLADWVIERFTARRRVLYDLQHEATRLRERPTLWCLAIVLGANVLVFWSIGVRAADGGLGLGATLVAAQAAIGVSGLAFGGLNWAMDGAAAPVASIGRLERVMPPAGALVRGGDRPGPAADHGPELRFRDVSFAYPGGPLVLEHLDLTVPAGTSLAIVGQNGAGKTTIAKLLCRLYDPTAGAIEIDGTDLRQLDLTAWRRHVTAVFQDFVRFDLPLRDNVAPNGGADDDAVRAALADAGGSGLAPLDTILAKGYPGGTDLSGGQWQRVALARALYAVRTGAGVVLLDEPTAQLDVRGEAEIFDRVLRATAGRTVILVSHRFSTVRRADRICVLEHGAVVELGSHAELMALGGRYRTMFDLQASRFVERDEHGEEVTLDVLD
jgi:ABC-type multidrug transport system fused ATPase/permease subunit